jgi:signal transduction histidine kinase/ActR/RegA family two-component response regulator
METSLERRSLDEERLKGAIDGLVAAVRANQSGADEIAALTGLVSQLRDANQNLVLAAVKAQVLQEEAEIRNRQQNEFLAMLAHELRNPMAPISNAANLLEKLTSAHPLLPQIQGVISRQVEHMARLIDDLLDASRITSGKIALKKSFIALQDVIGRSVEMVRPSIEQRHQQVVVSPWFEPLTIDGDLVRLSQAVSNLLVNASKFTPESGQISVSVARQAQAVLISVRDNGVGIEPDLLPHVFNLFMQGPRALARSEGGLGIGLSVAKGLVEMHGGTITVQSEGRNMGSQFDIVLPLPQTTDAASFKSATVEQPTSSAAHQILLIEDNEDTSATLKLLLELGGHRVTTAPDGITGALLVKENKFDVIVCDIGLPGMDGYGVIAQIRRELRGAKPLVIALSGYGQPEDHKRAIAAGFDHYLVKPIKGDALLQFIASQFVPN